MAVFKRYKNKRVRRGDKAYNIATWIAEGRVDSQRYKVPLPKESIKTAEQARAEDDIIRAQIRNGEFSGSRDKTRFAEYVDNNFLPFWEANFVNPKQKEYECKTLKSFFVSDLLKSIIPSRCEAFKRWRRSQPVRCQKCEHKIEHECNAPLVQNSTVNRELVTLKSILTRARADKKIKDNPMDFVPLLTEPQGNKRFLETHERVRLFAAIQSKHQLYAFVVVALLTGWRKQQILGLKRSDLEDGWAWRPAQKRKPRSLVRVHPMAYEVLSMLAAVRDEWLFVNPSGNRLAEILPAWWKACDDAGIENLRIHDLRHSFATEMLGSGANVFAIQDALNHSRLQTTQGYAHIKDEYMRTALEGLKTDDIPLPADVMTLTDSVM